MNGGKCLYWSKCYLVLPRHTLPPGVGSRKYLCDLAIFHICEPLFVCVCGPLQPSVQGCSGVASFRIVTFFMSVPPGSGLF